MLCSLPVLKLDDNLNIGQPFMFSILHISALDDASHYKMKYITNFSLNILFPNWNVHI